MAMADLGSAPIIGAPEGSSPLATQDDDAEIPAQTTAPPVLLRSASTTSTKVDGGATPSRGGTLKKKSPSLRRGASLKRSGSRKSLRSARATEDTSGDAELSVFQTPIPTTGSPTDILANRFNAWRKLLKDLITYFRDIQLSYEARSKALLKVANTINNTVTPSTLAPNGGLADATRILRGFHKQALAEASKARDIEEDVITQLNGLRSDLSQKIKEIKSLSGDFKNSVDKEKDTTRRAVAALQDALATAESSPSGISGKDDPFVIRLGVDRQVERQIDEENYLHRAYLNLEGSGRELECIVVGEIQKAYNAYAGILKREADQALDTVEQLRSGPVAMQKDHEWKEFVEHDPHFVNPSNAPRRLQDIHYPGKFAPLASEIRGGMLERKSKYLKSYTAGWYVLSPTHLHEFKSADHIHMQNPVMSLCLNDQKLGSRSAANASSHKFSLKGRQTGSMHRGHSWVFRAESHDTMVAWYEDIRVLTEKTGAERNAFVRKHARSTSGGSNRPASVSSDGLDEDEADTVPYSATSLPPAEEPVKEAPVARPEPGGRFPSDISVNRRSQAPRSPSSGSSDHDFGPIAAAAALPGAVGLAAGHHAQKDASDGGSAQITPMQSTVRDIGGQQALGHEAPIESPPVSPISTAPGPVANITDHGTDGTPQAHDSQAEAATALAGGGTAAAVGGVAYEKHEQGQVKGDIPVYAGHRPLTDPERPVTAPDAAPILASSAEQHGSSSGAASASTAPTSVEPQLLPSSVQTPDTLDSSYSRLTDAPADGLKSGDGQAAMAPPASRSSPPLHRKATDMSVSDLHVPGEFPPTPVG